MSISLKRVRDLGLRPSVTDADRRGAGEGGGGANEMGRKKGLRHLGRNFEKNYFKNLFPIVSS